MFALLRKIKALSLPFDIQIDLFTRSFKGGVSQLGSFDLPVVTVAVAALMVVVEVVIEVVVVVVKLVNRLSNDTPLNTVCMLDNIYVYLLPFS